MEIKDLHVDIELFDNQHQEIYTLIMELKMALNKEVQESELISKIDILIEKAGTHFKSEEESMQKYGYPFFEAHKKQHDALISSLAEKRLKMGLDLNRNELISTLGAVETWIVNHILEMDKLYTTFLKSHGMK